MARPLTDAQRVQNRAFLKVLRRTGNVRLACREVGAKYGTMQHRRRQHRSFARQWDAALAAVQARFEKAGRRGPSIAPSPRSRSRSGRPSRAAGGGYRTLGGEMTICRRNDGKLQMRRALPGRLTREAERAFLAALAGTCNITLAAAAAGASFGAFNRRRRKDPGFERAVLAALDEGYDRLEAEMIRAARAFLRGETAAAAAPAIGGMTAGLALALLGHHRKTVRILGQRSGQVRGYDVEEVRQRLERAMRAAGVLGADGEVKDDRRIATK